jgi:hypothetical protein
MPPTAPLPAALDCRGHWRGLCRDRTAADKSLRMFISWMSRGGYVTDGGLEKSLALTRPRSSVRRRLQGKIRLTPGSWGGEKIILKGQSLEVRDIDGAAACRAQGTAAGRLGPADRFVTDHGAL